MMNFGKTDIFQKERSIFSVMTIKSLVKRELNLSEDRINECIKDFSQTLSIKLFDGYFVLKASNIEATLHYESCEFSEDTRSVTFRILDLKPFYYKPFLNVIHLKFPFLKLGKNAEKAKLLTCYLNKIPALKDNKVVNSRYLPYLTIKYIRCTPGKVAVKLKIVLRIFRDLTSKLSYKPVSTEEKG
ncbi:MAG: hypothetical protein E3K32_01455 [wastewater metagenome]|nr:hypothetical protein [Candidatus Loosdrechtia aerotolerans]